MFYNSIHDRVREEMWKKGLVWLQALENSH